jgi:hypothetical protein
MDACTLITPAGWRNAPRFLAVALLAISCFATRNVSAADDDRPTHPSQYGDPRCESRRSGPRLERDELRCDSRVQPRRTNQHAPPSTPPSSSLHAPSAGQLPSIGPANTHEPSRPVERDVGFDDALVTQGNAQQQAVGANPGAAGANPGIAGANPGAAAGANPGVARGGGRR